MLNNVGKRVYLILGRVYQKIVTRTEKYWNINTFNSKLYHGFIGQFGAIKIHVLLSGITFRSAFPKIANGGKAKTFSQAMVNAFTCKAPGSE